MKRLLFSISLLTIGFGLNTQILASEYLVKLKDGVDATMALRTIQGQGSYTHTHFGNWVKVSIDDDNFDLNWLQSNPNVESIQKNYTYSLFQNPYLAQRLGGLPPLANESECPFDDPIICAILELIGDPNKGEAPGGGTSQDNPDIPESISKKTGPDPLFEKQWGMKNVNLSQAHEVSTGSSEVIVAVLDTGMDYTHEDLLPNLWRNPGETGLDSDGNKKETNGVDDDENGYVDDVIGWDFVDNDNKPYDMKGGSPLTGGNLGHGTHCSGSIAAKINNGMGIKGVAPNTKIMILRFMGSEGQGSTEGAVKALQYAIDNGARVTSNSWGVTASREEAEKDQMLTEAIQLSQKKGVLFIAAAGNGDKMGKGFDNDSSQTPAFPSSFDDEIIISVAAIDVENKMGSFSNWGQNTVDIAAPGMEILSTTVGGGYENRVKIPFLGSAPWAGTSMAAPFVSGAAALYWSAHPEKTWSEVKNAILNSASSTPSLKDKMVSDGRLNVGALMQ